MGQSTPPTRAANKCRFDVRVFHAKLGYRRMTRVRTRRPDYSGGGGPRSASRRGSSDPRERRVDRAGRDPSPKPRCLAATSANSRSANSRPSMKDARPQTETQQPAPCGEAIVGFKSLPNCQQGFELRANISPAGPRVKLLLWFATPGELLATQSPTAPHLRRTQFVR
jgi:hypothetical protein